MTARAVVIGVPHTTFGNNLPPLEAVTSDANAIAALLRARGFEHIELRAFGVTVDEMTALLLDLRAATQGGDLGLIYVSCHGYRVRDDGTDEQQDGYDECLVMSDGILPDDWFRENFWPDVAAGSQWVTCADTCFGATALLSYFRPNESDFADTPLLSALRRPALARISLAAAGESEYALAVTQGDHVYSWYTREVQNLIAEVPAITYRELWNRMAKRWKIARSAEFNTLASPWMVMTDEAASLADRPAFASLDYTGRP